MSISTEHPIEYYEWLDQQKFIDTPDKDVRDVVMSELQLFRSMEQREYILFMKWDKLRKLYSEPSRELQDRIKNVQDNIWVPKKPEDYLKLQPEVVYIQQQFPIRRVSIWGNESFLSLSNPSNLSLDWTILGDFLSTGDPTASTPGRTLSFLVRDKKTKKYLGILSLASDYLEIKERDTEIGWSREQRGNGKRIQYTAVGKVIVPTQPLGYSYVGGKLLSLLLTSEPVCKIWEEVYGSKLAGITTTSLYGNQKSSTQYDGLKPYWFNLGQSAGASSFKLSSENDNMMREWMKTKYPYDYWMHYVGTKENGMPLMRSARDRGRQFCYKKLNIPSSEYTSNHQRGVYFSKLYEDSYLFLQGKINEKALTTKRFDNSTENLVELWKTKYAAKRVKSLIENNNFSFESSFYSELPSLSWDETKERFL